MVIGEIYNQTKESIISYDRKVPVDPVNYDTIGLVLKKEKTPYYVYLEKEIKTEKTSFEGFDSFFPLLVKSLRLDKTDYEKSNLKSVENCKITGKDYCLKLINRDDRIERDSLEHCPKIKERNRITIYRFGLYGVLYSSNRKTAIVMVKIQDESNRNYPDIWGAVLSKKGKKWTIVKVKESDRE
ncbi:hypothetical protein [Pedobacter nutrimenti]|uniref:hypothetical protein n=1 Tax=Pedobacter nutrimenti TaxID=1241337 RepID=UPI00293183B7|nr:hypothetical protein [Pedobacter nutrimenti]